MEPKKSHYGTAADRWAGMGPYYAMFPSAFADAAVAKYSKPGETVLDPFSGRGTSLFSAASAGRYAIGIELNPVGWVYSRTKLGPAPCDEVFGRIKTIQSHSAAYGEEARKLPVFFKHCFTKNTREFLLCARERLDWRNDNLDRTVMAFLMIHLHGKASDSLSNQMRQTKAMAPRYAVNWWRAGGYRPPKIDPVEFFRKKLAWRYAKGIPTVTESIALLGDSVAILEKLEEHLSGVGMKRPSLMLTSPPYFGITNYHYDQWIRLWLLGGPPTDRRVSAERKGKHQGKFENLAAYSELLVSVFAGASKILRKDGIVYVRTDRREPTVSITRDALRKAFPNHRLQRRNQPLKGKSQTRLFGNEDPRLGEVDFILQP